MNNTQVIKKRTMEWSAQFPFGLLEFVSLGFDRTKFFSWLHADLMGCQHLTWICLRCATVYHGKSPLNHHSTTILGEYVSVFQNPWICLFFLKTNSTMGSITIFHHPFRRILFSIFFPRIEQAHPSKSSCLRFPNARKIMIFFRLPESSFSEFPNEHLRTRWWDFKHFSFQPWFCWGFMIQFDGRQRSTWGSRLKTNFRRNDFIQLYLMDFFESFPLKWPCFRQREVDYHVGCPPSQ